MPEAMLALWQDLLVLSAMLSTRRPRLGGMRPSVLLVVSPSLSTRRKAGLKALDRRDRVDRQIDRQTDYQHLLIRIYCQPSQRPVIEKFTLLQRTFSKSFRGHTRARRSQ